MEGEKLFTDYLFQYFFADSGAGKVLFPGLFFFIGLVFLFVEIALYPADILRYIGDFGYQGAGIGAFEFVEFCVLVVVLFAPGDNRMFVQEGSMVVVQLEFSVCLPVAVVKFDHFFCQFRLVVQ
jgi:hypothetical protein